RLPAGRPVTRRLLALFILTRATASVIAPSKPAGAKVIVPPLVPPTLDAGTPVSRRPGAPRHRWWHKRRPIIFLVVLVALGGGVAAWAFLTASATAGSNGAANSTTVNQGATPSAAVTAVGRKV